MFYLNSEKELTTDLLYKMLNKFKVDVQPKLQKYKNYYDGLQAIINKEYSDEHKPCNKTVINYCKNITDSYCGYMATPGYISYSSKQDIELIMNILRYNDYQAEDSSLLLDGLIFGKACELMYIDSDSKTRFKLISPLQSFGIYDDSLTSDLLYFVRWYKDSEWDDSNIYNVDVYTDNVIRHYTMTGELGNLTFISEEPHYFSQCPANIFYLPDEKSIFDCIMSVQDTYNTILSAEVDDYEAFCDAYLTLEACDLDDEQVASMKENRVLILPAGAKAQWLTKNASDAQVENILKRLHEAIYRIAACVDFSSDTFTGGVSSGVAIQFKLSGMETRCGKVEAEMKKALQRRVEIICGIATLKLGEDVFRDIDIKFKRNIPADEAAVVNMVASLKGIVSDATLLSMIPAVTDINAELDALHKQKEENMQMYGFGNPLETNDETNEESEE